jgi:hypothetical protein
MRISSRRAAITRTRARAPLARESDRLAIVLAMLRGVAPGVLARRADVDEALLYNWRDAFLAAGTAALHGIGENGSET